MVGWNVKEYELILRTPRIAAIADLAMAFGEALNGLELRCDLGW